MVFEAVSSFIASWLTPTCLFIFLNLVIGTIAIMCRFTNHHHQSQLARSTSLMDRLMSFNLCSYRFQRPLESKEVDHHDSVQENHDSARLCRADESVLNGVNSSQEEDSPEIMDDVAQHELTRTPSLLERLKSLKFYKSESIKKVKEEEPEFEPGRQPGAADPGLGRMNSEEGRRRRNLSSRRWEGEELLGEEVDKKADDFINRFKQQLRLQRLDSILRYREVIKRN
ncbi:hypothetical protein PIB30_035868 [Stylosanthes scabra]|uniref:DUF4408 domain-containing protein n=1 Tax=Stylosanthes scabra TaxID=79078 RepID=A0ABU6SDH9_9FABA|nr:hypothetical protein [Stylosanthes scabra]